MARKTFTSSVNLLSILVINLLFGNQICVQVVGQDAEDDAKGFYGLTPEEYNKVNGPQYRDAEELLQMIKDQVLNSQEKIDTILDVGCGSGKVTKLFSTVIPYSHLLACDADPAMVNCTESVFRNSTDKDRINASSPPSISLFVQDIAVPWENLSPQLRQVEGQVDLIWSNRVLHHVNHQLWPLAASNIVRLLRPGGHLYINIRYLRNFNELLPEEEREANEKELRIPGLEEQQGDWTRAFKEAGLSSLNVTFLSKNYTIEARAGPRVVGKKVQVLTFEPPTMSSEEVKRISSKFYDYFSRAWVTPFGSKLVDSRPPPETEGVTGFYGLFNFVGRK